MMNEPTLYMCTYDEMIKDQGDENMELRCMNVSGLRYKVCI